MRRITKSLLGACAAAAIAAGVGPAAAQQVPEAAGEHQSLPRDVRREVIDRWNAAAELRSTDRTEIEAAREVRGDVAVLRGPLIVAGHVIGNVLAINSDVILRPTAHIDGALLVVGGEVEGRSAARVDGSVRIYRQALDYRQEGDRIIAVGDDSTHDDEFWWRRLERRRANTWYETLRIVQAGPYNRVEGLPIEFGPALTERTAWGSVRFNAAGIIRTGSSFSDERGDFGDNLRAEVRVGHDFGVGVGGRLFSVVDPIEAWQLSDLETALAAFVARRDYRDYYQRHGGNGYVTLFGARNFSFTGSYGQERWAARELRNPFTIFNGERPWRPNPLVDEGLFHIADLALRFDTRTDPDDPWSGWYLNTDIEHGSGTYSSVAPVSTARPIPLNAGTDYLRGFFDARRYNRLGPSAQFNMRVVLGGWLGGDQLPIERRLSVDGPGALPGFGFRALSHESDVGTCTSGLGINAMAAECDRIALAQIEYRGDLKVDFTGDWEDWPRPYHSAHGDITWVFFADAGRGWKVGTPDGTMTYGSGTFPSLSSFRSDVGLGLDIAGIGIYAAKAVSTSSEPMNFFVRLRHRF